MLVIQAPVVNFLKFLFYSVDHLEQQFLHTLTSQQITVTNFNFEGGNMLTDLVREVRSQ